MKAECRSKIYYTTLLSFLLAAIFAISSCTNPEKAKIAHFEKGEAYLKDEKFQEASLEFRNATQIDEKLASAHRGLARSYEGLQRFQEVFEELRKTTDLDANNLDARVKLGNYYIAAAKGHSELIAEAERLATQILQKDANNVEGHILMGIFYARNEHDKAFAEINQAIELDPKRVEPYLSLARFYIVINYKAKAEETFQRAISVNSNSGLAHTEYGKYVVQLNRLVDAEAEMNKAEEILKRAAQTTKAVTEELASKYINVQAQNTINSTSSGKQFIDQQVSQLKDELATVDQQGLEFMQKNVGNLPSEAASLVDASQSR
ncbi:MAG: hypothetical protein ABJC10_03030 [Acidobacteriota bacterium]